MKTVVIQSCSAAPPCWIKDCMASVAAFAGKNGFDYQLLDDVGFFAGIAQPLREKFRDCIYPLTDLARLHALQAALAAGYERAVWLDADVVVFGELEIPLQTAMARDAGAEGGFNNYGLVFVGGDPLLARYIEAATALLETATAIQSTLVGPAILGPVSVAEIAGLTHFPAGLVRDVYPWLVSGGRRPAVLGEFCRAYGQPLLAGNLGWHYRAYVPPALLAEYDRKMAYVVQALQRDPGGINQVWRQVGALAH